MHSPFQPINTFETIDQNGKYGFMSVYWPPNGMILARYLWRIKGPIFTLSCMPLTIYATLSSVGLNFQNLFQLKCISNY